jgi:outer membrane protein W
MKKTIVDIKKILLLMLLSTVLHHQAMSQQLLQSTFTKYKPIEKQKWNMFGPIRITIQDFAVTDKYNDTGSGKVDGRFLDLANLNYGIGFYQNFSKKLAMSAEFMFGYGYISKKNPSIDDKARAWSETIRTDLYYHFLKQEMQMQPYLFVGMHGAYKMGNIYVTTPLGLGARYLFVKNNAMIAAQVGYGIGLTNGIRNSVIYSTGFYYRLKMK